MIQVFVLSENNVIYDTEWVKENIGIDSDISCIAFEDIDFTKDLLIISSRIKLSKDCIKVLVATANSYRDIGTVSPFLESDFKKSDIENEIKDGMPDVDEWNVILQACPISFCPDVEENVFDCIYIRAKLIQEIGVLTVEEMLSPEKAQWWHQKAKQLGWKHKLCGRAIAVGEYIYQSDEYYSNRINAVVRKTVDYFSELVSLFCQMHLNNGRLHILHYLLADFQEGMQNNIGGTQFHVSDLVSYQKEYYNVFVLARDGAYLRLTEYVDDDKKQFDFYVGDIPTDIFFYSQVHEDIYRLILKALNVNLVHVHHTMWMPLNIYYTANEYQIPLLLSIHDYYYICPVLNMINPDGKLCTKDSCNKDCQECLGKKKSLIDASTYLKKWYYEHSNVIDLCGKIVFPSEYARATVTEFYPQVQQKSIIIEHGIDFLQKQKISCHKHQKLRVAFIGGISDVKGGPVIYKLITGEKRRYKWYLMGGISNMELYHLKQPNLTKTGWYKRNEIFQLLEESEIDLICILSTVAETFCYTLSEALAAGIPVIATNAGALGKRVETLDCGWLLEREAGVEDIREKLDYLDKNRYAIADKQRKIAGIKLKTLEDMGQEYDTLYQEFLPEKAGGFSDVSQIIKYKHIENDNSSENNVEIKNNSKPVLENVVSQTLNTDIEEKIRLKACEMELADLKRSLLVQIAIRFRGLQIPGKQKIKKMIWGVIHKNYK